MSIDTAIDVELAYRRERVTQHFRPWRRVGAERRTAARGRGEGWQQSAAAASVIAISR